MTPRPGVLEADGSMTELGLMIVLELATLGSSSREIASYLRVTRLWLQNRLDEDHELYDDRIATVYQNGQGDYVKRLRKYQMNLAQVSAPMAIHLGKHALGQRDKVEIEHNHVHVIGTMPDREQTPEAWLHQYGPRDQKVLEQQPRKLDVVDAEYEDASE